MRRKEFVLLILLLLFPLLFPLASFSKEPLEGATIRIGIPSVMALGELKSDGRAVGLYPDLIREMFAEKSMKAIFVTGTPAECLGFLQEGEIDLLTTVEFSSESASKVDFNSEPVAIVWGQVFCRPGANFNGIMSLDGKVVAVKQAEAMGQDFIQSLAGSGGKCKILEFASHGDVLAAVQTGAAIAGVTLQHIGLREGNRYGLVPSSIRFSPHAVYFATRKGLNRPLLDFIDSKIRNWKKDGNSFYYRRLSHYSLGQNFYGNSAIPGWLKIILWTVIAIAMSSLLFVRILKIRVEEKTRELLERENEFQELVENANSIILRLDKEQRILFMNRFGLKLFGYSAGELIGQSVVGTIIHQNHLEGKELPKLIQGAFAEADELMVFENENQCKDGRTVFIQWSNRAIYDEGGRFLELLCIGTDVSGKRALEAELLQAQKMEAVGRLAGGIAHDLNNILFIFFGNAELARLNVNDPLALNSNLDQMVAAATRARDLVKQILAFSRKEIAVKKVLSLVEVVREAIKMLRSTFPATIKIEEEYLSDQRIMADKTQLYQIVMNLCTNSMHALNGQPGNLKITISEMASPNGNPGQPRYEKNMLRLSISDTGKGISKENLTKIFEPFFTTKAKNKGTGMGLAVVHGIVKEHGGDIRVMSEVDKGTTFELIFPMVKGNETISESVENEAKDYSGSERIMLIDDEQCILDAIGEILRSHGYEVTTFQKPQKAIIEFDKHPDRYDLIISDLTMPGITGEVLTGVVLDKRPDMPIFVITGHSEEVDEASALEFGATAFAYKPLTSEEMLKEVREILDSRGKRDGVRDLKAAPMGSKSFESASAV